MSARLSFAPVAPELAIDVLYVMGVAMRADGVVEAGERKALDAAARALGLGSFTMPKERPNALRLDRPASERALLFASAVWMIVADGHADEKERALLMDLTLRLRIDEGASRHLVQLARESFGIVGQDGHARDWTVAFSMLVAAVQDPVHSEL
jgi:uncharacterized membrane protein YebE (DUF533 family)